MSAVFIQFTQWHEKSIRTDRETHTTVQLFRVYLDDQKVFLF